MLRFNSCTEAQIWLKPHLDMAAPLFVKFSADFPRCLIESSNMSRTKHSSKMCTARLPTVRPMSEGGVPVQWGPMSRGWGLGCLCTVRSNARWVMVTLNPLWEDRLTSTHNWKHYLPTTSLAGGNEMIPNRLMFVSCDRSALHYRAMTAGYTEAEKVGGNVTVANLA